MTVSGDAMSRNRLSAVLCIYLVMCLTSKSAKSFKYLTISGWVIFCRDMINHMLYDLHLYRVQQTCMTTSMTYSVRCHSGLLLFKDTRWRYWAVTSLVLQLALWQRFTRDIGVPFSLYIMLSIIYNNFL